MPGHELRQFTPERLEAVRLRWSQLLGEDEFEVELTGLFDWCKEHLVPRDNDSHVLELYDPIRDATDAMVEIVNSKRGAMTKLLKLYVTPEYWPFDDAGVELRVQIVELHVAAFVQVLNAGMAEGAHEVKIYGRSRLMHSILLAIEKQWPHETTGWSATMQGRWLAICSKS